MLDMTRVLPYLHERGARLIGPNCPGLISPGRSKVGIIPGNICRPGRVGVVSRSGTLTYEIVHQLSTQGLGQSTCVGIGGDPLIGTSFIHCLSAFEADAETDAVVMIGEIGGTDEQQAADFVQQTMTTPVIGFIAGQTAPPGRRMGHAGAIISGGSGKAEDKMTAMAAAGIIVCPTPADIGEKVKSVVAYDRLAVNKDHAAIITARGECILAIGFGLKLPAPDRDELIGIGEDARCRSE